MLSFWPLVAVILASAVIGQTDGSGQPSDAVVQLAVQTAATQLSVSPDTLVVVASQPVQWADSSLGCPQPGMAYSQIVRPGWLITVDTADGANEVDVHTDAGSRGVIC